MNAVTVSDRTVIPEFFAMVGGDQDEGVVVETALFKPLHDLTKEVVVITDLAVVERKQAFAVSRVHPQRAR